MKLEQSFEVAAPLETVWEALIDVERVAPCLPGAAVTGRNEDGSYDGTFKVKIGPTSAAYTGKLKMEQVDEGAHTATMEAQGTDRRGQGGAKATIVSSLSDAGNGATRVEVSTDYHITGRLARFGRGGMIEDISNRLLNEFAKCLQTNLAGGTGEATPDAPAVAADQAAGPAAPASTEAASAAAPAPTEAAAAAAPAPTEAGPGPTEAAAGADADAEAAQAIAGVPTEAGAEMGSTLASGEAAAEQVAAAGEASRQAAAAGESAPTSSPAFQPTESEPVEGLSLMASALWGQAKRNPLQVAALVFGFLLALRVLRRRS